MKNSKTINLVVEFNFTLSWIYAFFMMKLYRFNLKTTKLRTNQWNYKHWNRQIWGCST